MKVIINKVAILTLLTLSINYGFSQIPNDSSYGDLISHFQKEIPELMKERNVVGVAVALTDENKIIWAQGFGYTSNDEKYKVDEETLFSLQSVTKVFTALSTLIAYQDGLIDIDIPIANYLQGFHFNSKFEENPENIITIRHLLSHKSGLLHEAKIGNNYDWQPDFTWRDISFEKHIESINNSWLRSPVGEVFNYSNCGIELTGYILQTRSNIKYTDYVKSKLLRSLQMDKSLFNPEYNELNKKNIAIGYAPGGYKELPWYTPMIPSGGLFSNVIEMSKLIQLFLNEGKINGTKIIDNALLSQMYLIPFNNDFSVTGYGLGMEIQTKQNTFLYGHSGGGGGFGARMIFYPKYKLGVVVLTNSMGGLSWDLAEGVLEEAIKNKKSIPNDKQKIIYKTDIKQYVGNYIIKRGGLPADTISIKIVDEKLIVNGLELDEVENGIFYNIKGNILIFDNEKTVTWNNLKFEKLK
jgi:CubicO group peptidase (beta-lactamase class C family)